MLFRFCPNLDRDALMSNFKGSHFHPKINKKMVKWYNRSKEIKAYEKGRAQRFQDDQDNN